MYERYYRWGAYVFSALLPGKVNDDDGVFRADLCSI